MNKETTPVRSSDVALPAEASLQVGGSDSRSETLAVEALTELRQYIRRSLREARSGMDNTSGNLGSEVFDELCDVVCALQELEQTIDHAIERRASVASGRA